MLNFRDMLTDAEKDTGYTDPEVVNEAELGSFRTQVRDLELEQVKKKVNSGKAVSLQETLTWGDTLKTGLSNIIPSAGNVVKDEIAGIYSVITSPIVTAKGAFKFTTGLGKRAFRKDKDIDISKDEDLQMVMDIENKLVQTYGTEKGFKEKLAEDPARIVYDVASMLLPVAKVTKLAKLGKVSKVAGKATSALAHVDALKLSGAAIKMIGKGIMNMPKFNKIPTSLYTRAIKLSNNLPLDLQERIVKIGLNNKMSLTGGNLMKLNDQIENIGSLIDTKLKSLDSLTPATLGMPGAKTLIQVDDLLAGFKELKKDTLLWNPIDGADGVADIAKAEKKIVEWSKEWNTKMGKKGVSPLEAQRLKQKLYRLMQDDYKKILETTKMTPFTKEAKMLFTKNIKETLESIAPDFEILEFDKLTNPVIQKMYPGAKKLSLKELNHLQGGLLNLKQAMNNAVQKIDKGSLFDFQLTAKASTGAAAGHFLSDMMASGNKNLAGGGFMAGIGLGILDSNPRIKSMIAVHLNNLKKAGISPRSNAALIRMGLYQIQEKTDFQKEIDKIRAVKKGSPSQGL